MDNMIEQAIIFATMHHLGQTDKAGQPYIFHCLRVMMQMKDEKDQAIAVLHDVVEDTDCTPEMLQEFGFDWEVVEALSYLTHQKEDSYEAYINRIKENPRARKVKQADLEDNMNLNRLTEVTEDDRRRQDKYKKAWVELVALPKIIE